MDTAEIFRFYERKILKNEMLIGNLWHEIFVPLLENTRQDEAYRTSKKSGQRDDNLHKVLFHRDPTG